MLMYLNIPGAKRKSLLDIILHECKLCVAGFQTMMGKKQLSLLWILVTLGLLHSLYNLYDAEHMVEAITHTTVFITSSQQLNESFALASTKTTLTKIGLVEINSPNSMFFFMREVVSCFHLVILCCFFYRRKLGQFQRSHALGKGMPWLSFPLAEW